MSLLWISKNERLQHGIHLINSITTIKFEQLLFHIAECLNNKTEIFSTQELKKLEKTLKLDESHLQLLIQSITYIFKQSCKVVLKPSVLEKQLIEDLQFAQEKAEEFVKIWSAQTNKDLQDFKNRKKLQNINWELNVETASSFCAKENLPNARICFNVLSDSHDKSEKINIQFNENDLLKLYNTFEGIQAKLDSVNNKNN